MSKMTLSKTAQVSLAEGIRNQSQVVVGEGGRGGVKSGECSGWVTVTGGKKVESYSCCVRAGIVMMEQ